MNHSCPQCSRPIMPGAGHPVGTVMVVLYCSVACTDAWFATHDRRHHDVWVPFERRAS